MSPRRRPALLVVPVAEIQNLIEEMRDAAPQLSPQTAQTVYWRSRLEQILRRLGES